MTVQLSSEQWLPETAVKARKRDETDHGGSSDCQPFFLAFSHFAHLLPQAVSN